MDLKTKIQIVKIVQIISGTIAALCGILLIIAHLNCNPLRSETITLEIIVVKNDSEFQRRCNIEANKKDYIEYVEKNKAVLSKFKTDTGYRSTLCSYSSLTTMSSMYLFLKCLTPDSSEELTLSVKFTELPFGWGSFKKMFPFDTLNNFSLVVNPL